MRRVCECVVCVPCAQTRGCTCAHAHAHACGWTRDRNRAKKTGRPHRFNAKQRTRLQMNSFIRAPLVKGSTTPDTSCPGTDVGGNLWGKPGLSDPRGITHSSTRHPVPLAAGWRTTVTRPCLQGARSPGGERSHGSATWEAFWQRKGGEFFTPPPGLPLTWLRDSLCYPQPPGSNPTLLWDATRNHQKKSNARPPLQEAEHKVGCELPTGHYKKGNTKTTWSNVSWSNLKD